MIERVVKMHEETVRILDQHRASQRAASGAASPSGADLASSARLPDSALRPALAAAPPLDMPKRPTVTAYGETTRPTFQISDYSDEPYSPSQAKVKEYIQANPALLQRNHYVLQHHWATAKHFDLRIQLDGATVSFAVPKGLSNWQPRTDNSETRLAVVTHDHPIQYSLFEGGTRGTTGCWDIGTYKILNTKNSMNPKKDYDGNPDTSDEELDEHEVQEDKFAFQYHRTRFVDLPVRYGQANRHFPTSIRAPNGSIAHRAFIIELTGKRYKGLRLIFVRSHDDWTSGVPKGGTRQTDRTRYMIKYEGITSEVEGDYSILSGRTMDQIRIDSGQLEAMSRRGGPGQWEIMEKNRREAAALEGIQNKDFGGEGCFFAAKALVNLEEEMQDVELDSDDEEAARREDLKRKRTGSATASTPRRR